MTGKKPVSYYLNQSNKIKRKTFRKSSFECLDVLHLNFSKKVLAKSVALWYSSLIKRQEALQNEGNKRI